MARIYKRKGIWYLDYSLGKKRIRKRISKDKHLAELTLHEIDLKKEKQELGYIAEDISLKELVNKYLIYSKANKSPTTFRRDSGILNLFLNFFKEIKTSKISSSKLEEYRIYRLKMVKSISVNREFATIRNMLKKAKEWGYILKDPTESIKPFKSQKKVLRFLSKEDISKILSNCHGQIQDIIFTFLNTGLRRSELVNLKWEDVNFKSCQIAVKETKSYKPRFIPVNEQLLKVLGKRKKGRGYVFTTKDGRPMLNNLLRRIKEIYRKAGIENANIHTFRHTFASHLIMAGVDLATVKELLGHSDIKTTMIYSHLAPEHLKGATERLRF